jgi:hypothetical protein
VTSAHDIAAVMSRCVVAGELGTMSMWQQFALGLQCMQWCLMVGNDAQQMSAYLANAAFTLCLAHLCVQGASYGGPVTFTQILHQPAPRKSKVDVGYQPMHTLNQCHCDLPVASQLSWHPVAASFCLLVTHHKPSMSHLFSTSSSDGLHPPLTRAVGYRLLRPTWPSIASRIKSCTATHHNVLLQYRSNPIPNPASYNRSSRVWVKAGAQLKAQHGSLFLPSPAFAFDRLVAGGMHPSLQMWSWPANDWRRGDLWATSPPFLLQSLALTCVPPVLLTPGS